MTKTYTVYLMDEEPETRMCGEFGHIVAGVFDTFEAAKSIAEQFKQYDHVIIMENQIAGLTGAAWQSISVNGAKEVWRWDATNDEFCS
jgi:hypothetical protein